jgi:hypothetical protein
MKRILFLAALVLVLTDAVYAQITNCAQTLRLARSTYDQGRLHELPTLMDECLKKSGDNGGFTKQQRVEAYQLLTLAYIFLEEPEKADETMLLLLRTDPYFKPNKDVDPAEFIALYRTFRTRPVYRLGVKFNLHSTQPNVMEFNPIANGTGKYKHQFGYSGGGVGEIPLTEDLTLNAELHYTLKSFSYEFQSKNPGETSPYATTSGQEKQTMVSLPILVQYRIKENRLNPFVTGGFSTDYLFDSSISGEEKRIKAQGIESQTFDVTPQRQKINISLLAGAGFKLFVAGGFIVTEVKYGYGLTRVNSSSTLLANQPLLFNYSYVDGVFKLNSLSFSIGYVQNFFNPKKVKRK